MTSRGCTDENSHGLKGQYQCIREKSEHQEHKDAGRENGREASEVRRSRHENARMVRNSAFGGTSSQRHAHYGTARPRAS
jgi:hypothetical protein